MCVIYHTSTNLSNQLMGLRQTVHFMTHCADSFFNPGRWIGILCKCITVCNINVGGIAQCEKFVFVPQK